MCIWCQRHQTFRQILNCHQSVVKWERKKRERVFKGEGQWDNRGRGKDNWGLRRESIWFRYAQIWSWSNQKRERSPWPLPQSFPEYVEDRLPLLGGHVWAIIRVDTCALACTEMTKTKKIEILQAVNVVELSWASIVIIFSFKSLHLGFRALPWTSHGSI